MKMVATKMVVIWTLKRKEKKTQIWSPVNPSSYFSSNANLSTENAWNLSLNNHVFIPSVHVILHTSHMIIIQYLIWMREHGIYTHIEEGQRSLSHYCLKGGMVEDTVESLSTIHQSNNFYFKYMHYISTELWKLLNSTLSLCAVIWLTLLYWHFLSRQFP